MKVLITGAAGGIGLACARKFAECGHDVTGLDIKPSGFEADNYRHIVCDITKELPEIKDVEILVNDAGVQDDGREIDVNLKGTIAVTEKYAIQPSIHSVVFIASSSATTGAEFPEYAASKGGILAYMRNTALRIAKYGATSNSISPGGVITDLNRHILDSPDLYEKVLNEALLHKWAEPEEIAEFVYFVSVINKSMTGEDIFIDNGEKIKSNFIW
jgi:NAD(P)-dependent dehydrogenase (short-subunit alcohol dehydrogenase family)